MDPDVTWGRGRGCPLVAHYLVDLQLGHGLRCCGNITRTQNVSEYMLVLALCLVIIIKGIYRAHDHSGASHLPPPVVQQTLYRRDYATVDDLCDQVELP